jgi:hypothetical protein
MEDKGTSNLSAHPDILVKKGRILERTNKDDRKTKIVCTLG